MSRDVLSGGVVLVLTLLLTLWWGSCQETVVSVTECVNGELVYDNQSASCQCYPGWDGPQCSLCRGRLKLTNSSGIIADDLRDMNYTGNTQCLFYIEANQSVNSIHLRIRLLHLECQWDYLHVFDGDSIFAPKLAAYTGDIIERVPVVTTNDTIFEPNITMMLPQHTLSSSGPKMLLYFYADAFQEGSGFELDYWLDYECPASCSERGQCNSTTGTCSCDADWTGEACHISVCPNDCSGSGVCDMDLSQCVCDAGHQGADCSVDEESAHWSVVGYNSSLSPSTLARAGHTSVVWEGSMFVYGGYRFPEEQYLYGEGDTDGRGSGVEPEANVLRYSFESDAWEVVETSAAVHVDQEVVVDGNVTVSTVARLPAPRYGHSVVVFNGSMYVFGGSLYPSEVITSELWALDLTSLQWTPLFNESVPLYENSSVPVLQLPVPVRAHTAHVVGSKMVVFFGLSPGDEEFPSYVQEYNFESGVWSLVEQHGVKVHGRMGHSSVYSQEAGLIYLHGGVVSTFKVALFSYDPVCGVWSSLSSPSVPEGLRYLHTSVLLGPLLLSFAGCQGDAAERDCFSSDLLVYNTLCDRWDTLELPGLPANASRYAHTSVIDPRPQGGGAMVVFGGFVGTTRWDMLRLEVGDCGQFGSEEDCVNGSLLCGWRREENECVSALELEGTDSSNVLFACSIDCLTLNMSSCSSTDGCQWNSTASGCSPEGVHVPDTSCPSPHDPSELCANLTSCQSCQLHNCLWALRSNESQEMCFSEEAFFNSPVNITETEICAEVSCSSHTSCESCTPANCLWCPSLSLCVNTYPTAFSFGQCLGWANTCQDTQCDEQTNCSSCQQLPQCGWCNDPSDTGLGRCNSGGFGGPQNDSCSSLDALGNQEEWQFYQCSACQCNGHSTCVNGSSVCEQCMNNTTGDNCESCTLGYFGVAGNGGSCAECDCNGYDLECDVVTGVCDCQALGVTGDRCTNCTGDYGNGDIDNFCYADLDVGFIYTFSVTSANEVQGFYAVTPPHDESLHFKFEVAANPSGLPIVIQLFLGRRSEDLWVLANLTEPTLLSPRGSFERRFDSFSSSNNESDPMIGSFAHSAIRDLENFTVIFDDAVENDYTSHMWDGDVTLILHVSNLNSPSSFRITVDQENFIYLLYFFATFITCFSVLLTVFLLVWFIKKKLAFRAYMRQQYIELQRRVARPFARVMLSVDNTPLSTTPLPTEQNPSYLGVEACRDDKAAVLSLMVQLPRDPRSGRPSHGRTGLCLGSTLVYVNSSKKPKQHKTKSPPRGEGQREENAFIVRTGRARQRHLSDPVA